jgi:hypothetical protein
MSIKKELLDNGLNLKTLNTMNKFIKWLKKFLQLQ